VGWERGSGGVKGLFGKGVPEISEGEGNKKRRVGKGFGGDAIQWGQGGWN